MIVLAATDVTKHFGPEPVLERVTLEVRPGDKVGLVGPNGVGKTTLLKILAGQLEADAGSVALHPSARVEYLEQQPQLAPGRTLWEEARTALDDLVALGREAQSVAQALSAATDPAQQARLAERYDRLHQELECREAYHIDHKIQRVLDGLGLPRSSYHQPVALASGGQQNRLLLAKLLLRGPDLMLLDEPSNHLDVEATSWLETFLAQSRQAMVVVSHDRYFLDKVTNRTWELFQGAIDDYPGNFSAYWSQRGKRLKVQSRAYQRQQAMIAKAEEFIRRNHYGQNHAQAKDREKKLARIERLRPPREIASPAFCFPPAARAGDIVVRADRLAKAYDPGAPGLFADLSFEIDRGSRWGILGPNGTGKTTLLRCVLGEERPDQGQVTLGTGVRIGYYDQGLSGLDENLSVVEAIRPPAKEFDEAQRRRLLARFGLVGDAVFQRVGSLSGGERSRAALAELAAAGANFLVLDEPTNHLDLWACDALERALDQFDGTVLFVSHDRYFLNRLADHLLVVEPGGFRVVEGNYDTYVHLVRQGLAGAPTAGEARPSGAGKTAPARGRPGNPAKAHRAKRRFPYRKLADLEAEIFEREARVGELHAALSSPEVLRDGQRARDIQAEVAQHRQALVTLYEQWEEAAELS